MQYLVSGTGLSKAFVYGIAHSAYVEKCPDYRPEDVTKYDSIVIHPVSGEIATGQEDWSHLPAMFAGFLISEQQANDEGWFDVPEVNTSE